MNDKPLMKCGHSANGTYGDEHKPICVICYGIVPGATEVDYEANPDLTGRKAKCCYCANQQQSNTNLPFFEHRPDKETDRYVCLNCIIHGG